MSESPSIILAFSMGMLTFLSPCLLPLVPAYISFISGQSLAELRTKKQDSKIMSSLFLTGLFFVFGFSVVFLMMGLAASALGQVLVQLKPTLVRVGGALVILFGLQLAGIFQLKPLLRERRYQGEIRSVGLAKAFVFGLAFAFGWSPCVGPILGSILVIAANQETLGQGVLLLGVYSLGLAIPFLLTAVLLERFFNFFDRVKNHFRKIEIAGGLILIAIGVLMVLNRYQWLRFYLEQILPESFRRLG